MTALERDLERVEALRSYRLVRLLPDAGWSAGPRACAFTASQALAGNLLEKDVRSRSRWFPDDGDGVNGDQVAEAICPHGAWRDACPCSVVVCPDCVMGVAAGDLPCPRCDGLGSLLVTIEEGCVVARSPALPQG